VVSINVTCSGRPTDPEAGAPAVIQVSTRGDKLLAYYPLAQMAFGVGKTPIYAVVDAATGAACPLLVPDPKRPLGAYVALAALSPDGTKVLMVTRLTAPDRQVWVSDLDGGNPVRLGEPLANAGAIAPGIIPTWATDGSVLISGGLALSEATLLRIVGSAAPPSIARPEPATPVSSGG
jgi:hypothetical protein